MKTITISALPCFLILIVPQYSCKGTTEGLEWGYVIPQNVFDPKLFEVHLVLEQKLAISKNPLLTIASLVKSAQPSKQTLSAPISLERVLRATPLKPASVILIGRYYRSN